MKKRSLIIIGLALIAVFGLAITAEANGSRISFGFGIGFGSGYCISPSYGYYDYYGYYPAYRPYLYRNYCYRPYYSPSVVIRSYVPYRHRLHREYVPYYRHHDRRPHYYVPRRYVRPY